MCFQIIISVFNCCVRKRFISSIQSFVLHFTCWIVQMSGKSHGLDCPICFDQFETTDAASKLPRNFPCSNSHTMCSACILTLASSPSPRCPTCREPPIFDIKVNKNARETCCVSSALEQVLRANTALVALLELNLARDQPPAQPQCDNEKFRRELKAADQIDCLGLFCDRFLRSLLRQIRKTSGVLLKL